MDEILEDSYVKTIKSKAELYKAIESLYDDPHVLYVDYKELVNGE